MSPRPLISAGVALGIGMGGFLDGIVFHQILQLHNMLSNRLPPITLVNVEINMFWDGLFHAFTWIMTRWAGAPLASGPAARCAAFHNGPRRLDLLGWGLFNLVEGLIDHQLLQIHHVHENGNHFLWDMAFLASGIVLILVGLR